MITAMLPAQINCLGGLSPDLKTYTPHLYTTAIFDTTLIVCYPLAVLSVDNREGLTYRAYSLVHGHRD